MTTPGKHWGLRRLADESGRFKMLAVDQRPPIKDLVRRARLTEQATYDDVANVKFLLLNEVTQSLLRLMQVEPSLSGAELLHRVALGIAHPDPQRVREAGAGVLADLRARDVLLGTRPD